MNSPTAPVINTADQAARVAAMATTREPVSRRLCADYLLGRATFFGTKNDPQVRKILILSQVDVDYAEAIFATKMVEAL